LCKQTKGNVLVLEPTPQGCDDSVLGKRPHIDSGSFLFGLATFGLEQLSWGLEVWEHKGIVFFQIAYS
jgi:hypothetical protein